MIAEEAEAEPEGRGEDQGPGQEVEPEPEETRQDVTEVGKQLEEQVVLENSNNNFPAIWSEEGKYLASVLGDALVKGLSLVSQRRPTDPVEYLANFLRTYKDGEEEVEEVKKKAEKVVAQVVPPVPILKPGQAEKEKEEVAVAVKDPEPEAVAEPEKMEEAIQEETEKVEEAPPPPEEPATESGLDTKLDEGYDKLEDALDEEEAATGPFDPEKEELAEKELIESGSRDPTDDAEAGAFPMQTSTRDENGQSVLHFACARPGGGSTIMAFLQNPSVNLAWRDTNMRTARDIGENLHRNDNVRVVDNWVMTLALRGDKETLEALLIDGYDHLADVEDARGQHIVDVAEGEEHREVALLLRSVPEFRERVERIHRCVRSGDIDGVKSLVGDDRRVAFALSPRTGRNAMHVAVLCEEVAIVKWLGEMVPECVKRGDNLERTCLHYAMGVDKVEKIVRVLVRAGAKRVVKDLRDRQPSWYFINRDEIGELQAEERAILN